MNINIDDIFREYTPYIYSDYMTAALNYYPTLIKSLKRLRYVPYEQITAAENNYEKLKEESTKTFENILYLLENYPAKIKKHLGKKIFNAKDIKLYAIPPIIPPQKINTYKQFINTISDEIFLHGDKHDYEGVVDVLAELIKYILKRGDPTLFNGVMIWLQTIFSIGRYPEIGFQIRDYIREYYELSHTDLGKASKHFNKMSQLKSKEKVITLKKGIIMFKGVKQDKKSRLTTREENYFLGFNPFLAFRYAQLPENPEDIPEVGTLREYCNSIGYIGVFTPKKDLKLINVGNYEMMKEIHEKAAESKDETVIDALNEAYSIDHETKTTGRYSDYDHDKPVSEFICKLGYDGYYGPIFNAFPPEVMICDSDDLKRLAIVPSGDLVSYCRGTMYDLNTVIIDNTEVSDGADIEMVDISEEKLPADIGKWSDQDIMNVINKYNLTNYGDKNRNILEIYERTNLLDSLSLPEIHELWKSVKNKKIIPINLRKNKAALLNQIRTYIKSYYVWNIQDYIKR